MTDDHDPLERELQALRPRMPSPELRRCIARELSGADARAVRTWRLAFAGALTTAACLAGLLLWREWTAPRQRLEIVIQPAPAMPQGETITPTLQEYRRALAESPEQLDALLARHSAATAPADDFRAFTRSDLDLIP
jgi:hypothetical protein